MNVKEIREEKSGLPKTLNLLPDLGSSFRLIKWGKKAVGNPAKLVGRECFFLVCALYVKELCPFLAKFELLISHQLSLVSKQKYRVTCVCVAKIIYKRNFFWPKCVGRRFSMTRLMEENNKFPQICDQVRSIIKIVRGQEKNSRDGKITTTKKKIARNKSNTSNGHITTCKCHGFNPNFITLCKIRAILQHFVLIPGCFFCFRFTWKCF